MSMGNTKAESLASPESWVFEQLEPLEWPWFVHFMQSSEFMGAVGRRYHELRKGILSSDALVARMDTLLTPLTQLSPAPAADQASSDLRPLVRHFQRWPGSLSN